MLQRTRSVRRRVVNGALRALVLSGLLAGAAHATGIDPRLPAPTLETVETRAGEPVTICWEAIGPGVEEFELILSLDGGEHWNLRISPEFDSGERRFVWKVPNLAAGEARLRIRGRMDGREVLGPASVAFRMVAQAGLPPESWLFWEHAWWDDSEGGALPRPGIAADAPGPGLWSGHTSCAVEPPGIPPVLSPVATSNPLSDAGSRPARVAATPSTTSRSRWLPLRE
jgi:hypothetical protein